CNYIVRYIKITKKYRKSKKILPCIKQIDTLAGEFPAKTNYLYLTYHGKSDDIKSNEQNESNKSDEKNKSVIVLGSGAYRIGSSVEFDWCCVNAVNTIKKQGYDSVMINYNPETVSTDYDTCDRLYFDELTFERVMDIIDFEKSLGVIVSTGGQIPNNLAMRLNEQEVKILGTSPSSIDNAEDRHKFSSMLDKLGIDQPKWKELSTISDIHNFVKEVGFPVLIRPSYVLSGAAMNVVSNKTELDKFLKMAADVSKKHPVVVSKFIEGAKEIEIDAVAENGKINCYAISEHIEFAGVHSGDATMVFPPQKTYLETIRRIKRIAGKIAKNLLISGPFNIQFLAKENHIKVIECNLRASRSFPFVSKVLKHNFIDVATKIMLGKKVEKPSKSIFDLDYVGIKAPQFSFTRLAGADPILGVEMASTGEVGCIGDDISEALLKSMFSTGFNYPKNILLSTGPIESKAAMLESIRAVSKICNLYATPGTAKFLKEHNIKVETLYWPDDKRKPNTLDYIKNKKIDLVINIPKNLEEKELDNDYTIRRSSVDFNIPVITNSRVADAFMRAISEKKLENISIKSWDEY
ncbi:MAG: ATP-grasp domain-containing protein, partial [Minisyncoccales bacterium]